MYVAGAALASGYLNKPELTLERFVPVPAYLNSQYSTMYKSGDLACLSNGVLCYQGRGDNQIKFRGYRIELDEIEKTLLKIPTIKNASVMVDASSGFQILVAFYDADNKLDEQNVKKQLNEQLPSYMIPDELFYVGKMPVNINGKVNKIQLQEFYENSKKTQQTDEIDLDDDKQKMLLGCWRRVLGDKIILTKQSNFFKSGGYSLLTFNLLSEINKVFNVETKIGLVNQYPVFSDLLEQINQLSPAKTANQIVSVTTDIIPSTYNQLALYYTCALQGSNTYNICFEIKFSQYILFDVLQTKLTEIINQNRELRTTFVYKDGSLCQEILPAIKASQAMKAHHLTKEEKIRLISQLATHSFNLNGDYLFDFHYLTVDEDDSSLFLNIHHTIFDGSSLNLLINELAHSLAAQPLEINRSSYFDYSNYQQNLLAESSSYFAEAQTYWSRTFTDEIVSNLSFSDVKAYRSEQSGNHYALQIDDELVAQIDNICAKFNTSPYVLYLLAYGFMLNNYTSQTKFAVGVPYANRPIKYLDTYGYFINTLPMIFDFSDSLMDVKNLFNALSESHLNSMKYQELPLSIIMKNHISSNKINTFFAYQRGILRDCKVGDLQISLEPVYNQTAKFDLFLAINELSSKNLEIAVEFEHNVLSMSFVQNLVSYYIKSLALLTRALSGDNIVSMCDIISQINSNKQVILNGTTHYNECQDLISLFKLSVLKTPNQIAIFDDTQTITYQELDTLTDKIAKKLVTVYGDHESKLIGLYFRRDINMPIYILAILKAGFAYIPLNEEFPPKRIEYISELSCPATILTNVKEQRSYLYIDDFMKIEGSEDESKVKLPDGSKLADSLAYIMFTSGTTGQPKGVSLSHKALANRIIWMRDKYKLLPSDVMLMKTPFNFDVSCGEIFTPLTSSAKLFVSSYLAHKNIEYIIDTISNRGITHIYFVPTMLNIFLQFIQGVEKYKGYDFSKIKMIFCSGEALNQAIIHECYKVFPHVQIYNQYGPTEAGEVSDYLCKPNDKYQIVPIGEPINNTQFIVVNKNQQPVSQGTPGELLIAGASLAEGYYNQELLTKQKFVYFPTMKQMAYKTGDLVVYDQYNNLCFLERMDNQTKINGVRIELGEIEQALLAYDGISQAFVCVHRAPSNSDKLIAFYVTTSGNELSASILREFLNDYLPQYMLPTNYFHLANIPVNINGKIDRVECIKMFQDSLIEGDSSDINYEQCSVEEQQIIIIWSELLNRDKYTVSTMDNFLLSGGSSLLISRLILELDKQLKFSLNMFDIINEPTLANLLKLYKHGKKANDMLPKVLAADLQEYATFEVDDNLQPMLEIKVILLTGASGFIGRNTLKSLRTKYPEAHIICMQRGKFTWMEDKNIAVLSGDLEKHKFGLSEIDYNYLAQNVDVIIHIGATVNHLFGYNEHKTGNVVATRDLINLALKIKRKRLVFISTTGTSAHDISCDTDSELGRIKDYGGYLLSKMIAEKLVYRAVREFGLQASILRLGYVGPNVHNYDINYENNHLYALFKSFYHKGCAPENFGDFECLAVNDVAENIVAALENTEFKLTDIANRETIEWAEIYRIFNEISGNPLQIIKRSEWVQNIIHQANPLQDDYLYKLIPLYNITENDSTEKSFKLTGDVISSYSYKDIVKAYIRAVEKFG